MKNKNAKTYFADKIMEATIFDNSSASFINCSILDLLTSKVSLIKHNQYLVWFADFKEIYKKLIKSFLCCQHHPQPHLHLLK